MGSVALATTLAGGAWETADPEHAGGFTAVGYFFARELRRHHDVPIGLINTSWGGSRIEPWMSAEALGVDAATMAGLLDAEAAQEQATLATLRAKVGELPDRRRRRRRRPAGVGRARARRLGLARARCGDVVGGAGLGGAGRHRLVPHRASS